MLISDLRFLRARLRGALDRLGTIQQNASVDTLAMQVLAPLSPTYLPWTPSAMRPSGLVAVLNDIVVNRRTRIVECGAGISTVYIARLLAQLGSSGRLTAVEHNAVWAGTVRALLAREGLNGVATVVHAPLAPFAGALDGSTWYDECVLADIRNGGSIDLLVVDGPPAFARGFSRARYPAVPFFQTTLAPDFTVILDDIDRAGERDIARRWERLLRVPFERRVLRGGIAIGRSAHWVVI